jgi:hypothetical protein
MTGIDTKNDEREADTTHEMIALHEKSESGLRGVESSILPLAEKYLLGWQIAMWTEFWQGCLDAIINNRCLLISDSGGGEYSCSPEGWESLVTLDIHATTPHSRHHDNASRAKLGSLDI